MLTRKRDDVLADLEAQTHRRFIKSHTPLDGLPFDPRVTYITVARDLRDVAISWDNHVENMNLEIVVQQRADAVGLDDLAELFPDGFPVPAESSIERLWEWVDAPANDQRGSLVDTVDHLRTFWDRRSEPNVVLLHYADLSADLAGQMRRLAARLGIEVAEERWPALVEAATFQSMRRRAEDVAPATGIGAIWKDTARFFNKGTNGQWRELLDEEGVRRFDDRLRSLASPELIAWINGEVSVAS
jgi:hypothetical protein